MIGERVKRIEDPALLRGQAVFVDDIHLAGLLQAAFVRSPHPHALLRSIDTTAAKAFPGVAAVYTLADFSPHIATDRLPLQFPSADFGPDVTPFLLAGDEVCHVGEVIAMVIASGDREWCSRGGLARCAREGCLREAIASGDREVTPS